MSEKKFIAGLYANKRSEKQPEFVQFKLKIKPSVLIESLREFEGVDGYISLQVNTPYQEDPNWPDKLVVKLDEYQNNKEHRLTPPTAPVTPKLDEEFDDDLDLPF